MIYNLLYLYSIDINATFVSMMTCKTGCNEFVKEGSIYCEKHSCTTCNKLVSNDVNNKCRIHTCKDNSCNNPVDSKNNTIHYCAELHKCSLD